MKKTVIVACGGAVATSTIALERIKEFAQEHNIEIDTIQCRVNEISMYTNQAHLIVTTSKVTQEFGIPLIHGISLVSGIGEEKTLSQILEILTQ